MNANRRVALRGLRLLGGGAVAAAYVWGIALSVALLTPRAEGAPVVIPRTGDLFAAGVDPVLPTLVGALLALAVMKAGGFASGFIVGASSLIGGTAVMWMLLSASAVLGPDAPENAGPTAIAAVAMAAICVIVAVAVSEVLPLSERSRRRQLRKKAADKRDAAVRLRERVQAHPVLAVGATPYAPARAWGLLIAWYAAALVIAPLAMVPYAVTSEPSEGLAAALIGGILGLLLGSLVALCHWLVVERYELPTPRSERQSYWVAFGFVVACAGATVALCVALFFLVWPIPLIACVPLVVVVVVLLATFLPMLRPMRRLGLLAQVAVADRSFALQRAGWRYDELLGALDRVRRRG